MLEKQDKAQSSQDNRRNMVNKLENGRTVLKLAPQHQMKPTHHKKKKGPILMKRLNMQEAYS
jgi:hypothetical protein